MLLVNDEHKARCFRCPDDCATGAEPPSRTTLVARIIPEALLQCHTMTMKVCVCLSPFVAINAV